MGETWGESASVTMLCGATDKPHGPHEYLISNRRFQCPGIPKPEYPDPNVLAFQTLVETVDVQNSTIRNLLDAVESLHSRVERLEKMGGLG